MPISDCSSFGSAWISLWCWAFWTSQMGQSGCTFRTLAHPNCLMNFVEISTYLGASSLVVCSWGVWYNPLQLCPSCSFLSRPWGCRAAHYYWAQGRRRYHHSRWRLYPVESGWLSEFVMPFRSEFLITFWFLSPFSGSAPVPRSLSLRRLSFCSASPRTRMRATLFISFVVSRPWP